MKKRAKTNLTALLAAMLLVNPLPAMAQTVLTEIDDVEPEEVYLDGFYLDSPQELQIVATGVHLRSRAFLTTTAWILNADNREVVWELTDANSKWKNRLLREYSDRVTLPNGRYEVYYSAFPNYYREREWSLSNLLFGRRRMGEEYEELFGDLHMKITGQGRRLQRDDLEKYRQQVSERAIFFLQGRRDDLRLQQGFRLTRPVELIVYALGEARPDGAFDYGWIINTETRQRVWRLNDENSAYGGGNEKNRLYRGTVTLPAGSYAAFFVTDDSHSPRQWNAAPPYDPYFWGLSLYLNDASQAGAVSLFDYEDIPPRNVVADLSGLRNDETVSRGFTLKKDMKLRIYALGEGFEREMVDYGWIIDAHSRRQVWEMKFSETEHAGGSEKNRLFDGVIDLPKGSYIVNFVTDDSHSYRHWNAAPPFDPEHWGIIVLGAGPDFRPQDVGEYRPEEDPSYLVQITRVRDDEERQARFTLEKEGLVRIFAEGEGVSGEMFDYGWIEEASSGRVVWEMTYRNTHPAGGARKNRVFDDSVFLHAGEYVVHFQTDDSHSFGRWNAAPPADPTAWGITVQRVKD